MLVKAGQVVESSRLWIDQKTRHVQITAPAVSAGQATGRVRVVGGIADRPSWATDSCGGLGLTDWPLFPCIEVDALSDLLGVDAQRTVGESQGRGPPPLKPGSRPEAQCDDVQRHVQDYQNEPDRRPR